MSNFCSHNVTSCMLSYIKMNTGHFFYGGPAELMHNFA